MMMMMRVRATLARSLPETLSLPHDAVARVWPCWVLRAYHPDISNQWLREQIDSSTSGPCLRLRSLRGRIASSSEVRKENHEVVDMRGGRVSFPLLTVRHHLPKP